MRARSGTERNKVQPIVRMQPVLSVVALLLLVGCGGTRTYHLIPVPMTQRVALQSSALTADQELWLAELCPFGTPEMGPYYQQEPLTLIVREGYAIMHSDRAKTPVWVCERVRHEDSHGPLRGRDRWNPDPVLCSGRSRCERGAVDSDYRGTDYDRGHLAPNLNQRLSSERKRETFYFSNAAPQVGRKFNQSTWQALEMELAGWTAKLGDFWTITGVLYYDEREDDPNTATGFIEVKAIGAGSVFVPTHFYKVVVWQGGDGIEGFALVMENRPYASRDAYRDAAHHRPIRWLEERLGVNFMPLLEPGVADALETGLVRPFP